MPRRLGNIGFASLVSVVLCSALLAQADSPLERAKRHFLSGKAAYDLGDFPKAVQEYKAAYQEKSDSAFLYNIAQAYRMSSDLPNAVFFYRSYLRNAPEAPNRLEVEGRISRFEMEIASAKAAAPLPATAVETKPLPVTDPLPTVVTQPAIDASLVASRPPKRNRAWIAGIVVGGIVVVGLAVGLGIGLGANGPTPPASALGSYAVFK